MSRTLYTGCAVALLSVSLLWGRCVSCPVFDPQPVSSHGCCDPQPAPKDCENHSALQCGERDVAPQPVKVVIDSPGDVGEPLAVPESILPAAAFGSHPRSFELACLDYAPDLVLLHSSLLI